MTPATLSLPARIDLPGLDSLLPQWRAAILPDAAEKPLCDGSLVEECTAAGAQALLVLVQALGAPVQHPSAALRLALAQLGLEAPICGADQVGAGA